MSCLFKPKNAMINKLTIATFLTLGVTGICMIGVFAKMKFTEEAALSSIPVIISISCLSLMYKDYREFINNQENQPLNNSFGI